MESCIYKDNEDIVSLNWNFIFTNSGFYEFIKLFIVALNLCSVTLQWNKFLKTEVESQLFIIYFSFLKIFRWNSDWLEKLKKFAFHICTEFILTIMPFHTRTHRLQYFFKISFFFFFFKVFVQGNLELSYVSVFICVYIHISVT